MTINTISPDEKDQVKINGLIKRIIELLNGISDFTITLLALTTAAGWRSALGLAEVASVRGLTGVNNGGTSTSQMDVTYSEVVMRDSTGGSIRHTSGSFTINTATAGPALNGRDQAGAFGASQWLHFYAISGAGQTTGGLVSTVASTTVAGPTLPSGYTNFAYLFSVYWNGSSQLLLVTVRGPLVSYISDGIGSIVNGGAAGTETAVSTALVVPPNATNVQLELFGNDLSGGLNSFTIKHRSGSNFMSVVVVANGWTTASCLMPNVNQNIYYVWGVAGSSGFVRVLGYLVPNGDS